MVNHGRTDSGEDDVVRAVNAFDRTGLADVVASAERDRRRVTDDFPLVEWPRLEVERHALGAGQTQPFCWMLEAFGQLLGEVW